MVVINKKTMKLFHVMKNDVIDKNQATYIVKADSESAALQEVGLTSADLAELNADYINQPFPRYSVSVEEIDLTDRKVYRLD